ncbi:uncharacterized protein Dwil_GK23337 [Drosophila willistoni]|uniref:Uncharacterized protein n=1 Tax=Drosophila willistoni TaxID=7260 RepID=B4NNK8_DROWI|nr:uncharacterized protein LOC6652080 [Drosophila willistoni]EDW85947.1 uncharacterized protein Dwil_GK23337 [Drosophila willistoni]
MPNIGGNERPMAMTTIDDIASELERTHLSRAPELLRHLETIHEPENEMGRWNGKRLKESTDDDMGK